MRQDDGVGLGMGQVEGAAERVAKLVMQRHADGAEADAAEPRAVERLLRASRSPGFSMMAGRASANARMPSSAISEITGFWSRA